jgi:hypothetical protein
MANGGIIGPLQTPINGDLITQFTAPGTFIPLKATADVLVVAGGGGGTTSNGGGGGAGGVVFTPAHPLPGSPVPVTVGAGGATGVAGPAPEAARSGGQGSPSTFGSTVPLSATGGGFGRAATGNGGPGGSGGGAGYAASGGTGTPGQGNDGGPAGVPSPQHGCNGGGGGKAAAGTGTNPGPAPGGNGENYSPTFGSQYGDNGYFGGGGGGTSVIGSNPASTGGLGGGGDSTNNNYPYPGPALQPAESGMSNTGGGGGASGVGEEYLGGTGGSGAVLVKQANVQSAPGVWSLEEAYFYKKQGLWPTL